MPFLKNTWYVAAHANELDNDALVGRTICNQKVVMFRTSNGEVKAIEDRCPHRFVPLSLGKRIDDSIQCAYHGLRFDGTGACVEAPNDDDNQKARACIKAYVAVERYAVIWLWLGEAELADPSKIPEFDFISNTEKFAIARGYTYLKGNYQLISDNLLDLSHIHYLHPAIHKGSNFADFTNEVKREGDTVWSMLWRPHYAQNEQQQYFSGLPAADVEGQGHSRWDVPGVLLVHTAFWEHGKSLAEGASETPNAHLITPETEFTSHYFWASGRTTHLENVQITQGIEQTMKTVFETQDGQMVEAQQLQMGESTDFLQHKPIIMRADAAGVLARRIIDKKIRDEKGGLIAVSKAAEH